MTTYRIYYKMTGVTYYKHIPCETIQAANAEAAVEAFRTRRSWADIVFITEA